ncbi:cytochrome c-type biogenesis protein [Halovenus aranensis]|uniref:Cytochrome c-type biogenesis protein n=1 Tax=Halovenus aranensis TaxID=890420 RepID=A0A1G8VRC9_9EURY|nr:cytochrome c biogenesis protein CcdA [Halovenus aranensis]SDJ68549.1 cytochrome c-type biogenesis protein [Halovenus aranensis]
MSGTLYGTATFALGAGVVTFFSPCVYALLPGYVGYYVANVDAESAPLSGALARGGTASLGALGTFTVLSAVAFAAGEVLERFLPVFEYLVGALLVVFGVLVVYKGAFSLTVTLPERQETLLGFGVFGAMYALAATACVLPLFLSVSLVSVDFSPVGTALVLGAYAGSFAALMVATTVMTALGQERVLSRFSGHAGTLSKAAGVLLVCAGLLQVAIVAGVGL